MEQNENARERPSEAAQDEILATILKRIGGTQAGASTASIPASASSATDDTANPLGSIISSLLSNPDLIAKLPLIISSVKPIIEMLGKGYSASPSAVTASAVEASTSAQQERKNDSPAHKGASDSRTALLCAMKPYLSEDRRNAVDYIVKLSRLGEMLKTL